MSELVVHLMREEDIDGAIDTIQQAFADDPYNNWIYPSREGGRYKQKHQLHPFPPANTLPYSPCPFQACIYTQANSLSLNSSHRRETVSHSLCAATGA